MSEPGSWITHGRGRWLVEQLPVALRIVRVSDLTVVFANPAAQRLFGDAQDGAAGGLAHDAVDGSPDEEAALIREGLASQGSWRGIRRLRAADGTPFWARVTVSPAHDEHERAVWVMVYSDFAEPQRRAEQLEEELELERRTSTAMRDAEEAKNEHLRQLAHDLRTPLAAVSGYVDLLRRRDGELAPEERLAMLSAATLATQELSVLVNRVAALPKIDSGRFALEVRPVVLLRDVEALLAELQQGVAQRSIVVDVADDVVVLADPEALTQVLLAVISDATRRSASREEIRITASPTPSGAVRVAISGGAAPVDAGTPPEQTGDGAAFGTVHQYVALHGGSAGVERGESVTVWFTLPAAP